jgi:type I restriction enzyme S subunit
MELMPGYKQTEVGVIPDDWDVSTVGREFEIKLGKMLDAERNTGVPKPYLGNKAVQWGRINLDDLPTVPMTRADINCYRLREGDLLVCEGGEVGRAAIWHGPIDECYYQKAIHRLRALHGFEPSLMVGLLRRWADSGRLANYVTKTSIAHLPREKFLAITMPVPPQAEQRLISQVLCDLDALVAQLDGLIAKKRNIKQAAMQELLTGKRRLPGFQGEWEVKRLKDIIKTPVTDGPHMTPRFLDTGVPFLSVNNLVNNRIDLSDLRFISEEDHRTFSRKCKPQKGDILLGKAASVGKVAIVESDAEFNIWSPIALARIADSNSPKFIYYALQSRDLASQISLLTNSSSQGNIGMSDIEKLSFRLPDKKEQTAIASVLSEMDAELAGLEARMEKAQQLKQGMMQQLLTGKVRLK